MVVQVWSSCPVWTGRAQAVISLHPDLSPGRNEGGKRRPASVWRLRRHAAGRRGPLGDGGSSNRDERQLDHQPGARGGVGGGLAVAILGGHKAASWRAAGSKGQAASVVCRGALGRARACLLGLAGAAWWVRARVGGEAGDGRNAMEEPARSGGDRARRGASRLLRALHARGEAEVVARHGHDLALMKRHSATAFGQAASHKAPPLPPLVPSHCTPVLSPGTRWQ